MISAFVVFLLVEKWDVDRFSRAFRAHKCDSVSLSDSRTLASINDTILFREINIAFTVL